MSAFKTIEVRAGSIQTDNILNSGRLELIATGSARLNVSGKAGTMVARLKGTSQSDLNLDAEQLSVQMAERSNARIYTNCEDLQLALEQNAVLDMEGDIRKAFITQSQQSKYRGEMAPIGRLQLSSSGETLARVHATEAIGLKAIGNSRILLFGNPSIDVQEFRDGAQLSKKALE